MNRVTQKHFDVFNGDADGLCALQQLRLAEPRDAIMISGVKRTQTLLERVNANPGDSVTVLDLPVNENRNALLNLLDEGVSVEYFDHHLTQCPPQHALLRLTNDQEPDTCTSLVINHHLHGRFGHWAVVGAFGDERQKMAEDLALSLGLSEASTQYLKALGQCLNYNVYGESERDWMISPAKIRKAMAPYVDPFEFMAREGAYTSIAKGWEEDMNLANEVKPILDRERLLVTLLPNASWARRVVGCYATQLSSNNPEKICAALVPNGRYSLNVSLRTPPGCRVTADWLVRRYGGGGRAMAAGINDLPLERVTFFLRDLQ